MAYKAAHSHIMAIQQDVASAEDINTLRLLYRETLDLLSFMSFNGMIELQAFGEALLQDVKDKIEELNNYTNKALQR